MRATSICCRCHRLRAVTGRYCAGCEALRTKEEARRPPPAPTPAEASVLGEVPVLPAIEEPDGAREAD
jgi:hypothetical protein